MVNIIIFEKAQRIWENCLVFTAEWYIENHKYSLFLCLAIFASLQISCSLLHISTYIYWQYLLFRLRNDTRFTNSELAHSVTFIILRALHSCVASETMLCKKAHCEWYSVCMQMSLSCCTQSYGKRVSLKDCHDCMVMQPLDMKRNKMAVTGQIDGAIIM
jgi:hypothetical protein